METAVTEVLKKSGFCEAAETLRNRQRVIVGLFPYETVCTKFPREHVIGYIDPFARKNHYREMVERLQSAAGLLRQLSGLPRSAVRVFVNSPLPEKEIAVSAGLGFRGKSTLLISPRVGVNTLIGGLIVLSPSDDRRLPNAAGCSRVCSGGNGRRDSFDGGCGSCRACIEACPVGALSEGGLDRSKCLQSLASQSGEVPKSLLKHWDILYGCSRCRDVCPYSRFNHPGIVHHRGEIDSGETLADWLLMAVESEASLSRHLKSTPLGMGWIEKRALIRNAVILCRRLNLYPEETERVCRIYKNEFSVLSSVDIPPLLEYSEKSGVINGFIGN